MIKQWYSTTAAEFASMTDVTDEEIREASRGEVSKMTAEGEDTGDFTATLQDERIFGMIPRGPSGPHGTHRTGRAGRKYPVYQRA